MGHLQTIADQLEANPVPYWLIVALLALSVGIATFAYGKSTLEAAPVPTVTATATQMVRTPSSAPAHRLPVAPVAPRRSVAPTARQTQERPSYRPEPSRTRVPTLRPSAPTTRPVPEPTLSESPQPVPSGTPEPTESETS